MRRAVVLLAIAWCGASAWAQATRPATGPTTQPDAGRTTSHGALCGAKGGGERIVYLLDASGTMLPRFDAAVKAVQESVDSLHESQSFSIVCFRDENEVLVLDKSPLLQATAATKKAAREWLNALGRPKGATEPADAIKKAFALRPDQIYVISDGFDNSRSYDAIAALCTNQNVGKKVRVSTIMFQTRFDGELRQLMRRIASDGGGEFVAIPIPEK